MQQNNYNENEKVNSEEIIYEAEEQKNEKPAKKGMMREILEWIQAIAIAAVLAILIRNFVFTVVRVDGQSMESTLKHNDRMVVWRLGYEPEAGDIIVFKSRATDNRYWIKRVIATEGQHVKIDFDKNTIIYAHGRLDNTMFGSLKKIISKNDKALE